MNLNNNLSTTDLQFSGQSQYASAGTPSVSAQGLRRDTCAASKISCTLLSFKVRCGIIHGWIRLWAYGQVNGFLCGLSGLFVALLEYAFLIDYRTYQLAYEYSFSYHFYGKRPTRLG
jgi:hypothetical protein